ncbi:MAG: prenyltransferase [Thaumarchaeota archaeon]|nr:prenyltransferase [Nitrososphaerota archaeon]
MSKVRVWFEELRPPFLILSIVFTILGILVALKDGYFNPLYAVLTLVGVAALHAAANVLNDYFDYRSGINVETERTPFSGGSGILPSGRMTPRGVLVEGVLLLLLGLGIGLYFLYVSAFNPILIFLIVFAGVGIVLYSPIISHIGFGEVLVGLCFGPPLLLGIYFVQTSALSLEAGLIGLVTGILTAAVLYVNEFPDTKADVKFGRYHVVARLGKERAARVLKYIFASAYIVLVISSATNIIPLTALIGLATIPHARIAYKVLKAKYEDNLGMIPAMASTVKTAIFTGVLLIVAYLVVWIASLLTP